MNVLQTTAARMLALNVEGYEKPELTLAEADAICMMRLS